MLYCMGRGGGIVLADTHFLGDSTNANTLFAGGLRVSNLLNEILLLVSLYSYIDSPIFMTLPVPADQTNSVIWRAFRAVVDRHWLQTPPLAMVERFAFYE